MAEFDPLDPAEVEFIAESASDLEIVPNFNDGVLYLLDGDVGPFRAGIPLRVPLWVALNLRRRQKCRVVAPDWLTPERLEAIRDEEKEAEYFTRMPHQHFFVLAHVLLDDAAADVADADKLKTLLKDVWDVRQSKLRKSVDAFVLSGRKHAQVDHLQGIEMNAIRPILNRTLDRVHELETAAEKSAANNSTTFHNNSSSVFQHSSLGGGESSGFF